MKTVTRYAGVAIAICSWIAVSNHCAFAAVATEIDKAQTECPFHSKPAKQKKQSSHVQCREILRREFSRSDGRVRSVFVASRCAAVTRHGTTRRIFVRRIDFAAESSRSRSAGSRLRIVIRDRD